MSDIKIQKLVEDIGIDVETLLKQLESAGVSLSGPDASVTEEQKSRLLLSLKSSQKKGITLKRKKVSELTVGSDRGRTKKVKVEVRRKRTYVKREPVQEDPQEAAAFEEGKAPEVKPVSQEVVERRTAQDASQAVPPFTVHEKSADLQASQSPAAGVDPAVRSMKHVTDKPVAQPVELSQSAELSAASGEKNSEQKKAETKPVASDALDEKKPKKVEKPRSTSPEKDKRREPRKLKKNARQKISTQSMVDDEFSDHALRSRRRRKLKGDADLLRHEFEKPVVPKVHEIEISETITVSDLAQRMSTKAVEVIKVLIGMGAMATINEVLDQDTAVLVIEEMGHVPKILKENQLEDSVMLANGSGRQVDRPPVVTVMGHVDHGKTSLLDYIRRTKVTSGEAGGITQHIGAYHVQTLKGMISFLDTPGHEAFTAMRARGARCTDIVVLVVAADDGVKPQTIEAIQHAKAGGVPLIVAVNKIDKEGADPERVKTELSSHDVIPEDWGGDTMFQNISAKKGDNIDALLDMILLQAEVLELKATIDCPARGVVIESFLDKGRGPVATLLVKNGVLKRGDVVLAGTEYGRVKALLDETGCAIKEAGPSIPVEILGLSGTASAGDEAIVVSDEKKAREVAFFRQGKYRDIKLSKRRKEQMESVFSNLSDDQRTLNIMLKADVQGSVEALTESLLKLSNDEVKVKMIASGVGGITESDVNLGRASNAMIIGFNVRADAKARRLVESEQVLLNYYSVIYDVIEDVRNAVEGMLDPERQEKIVGLAEVRDVFRSPKFGAIAGCMVVSGIVKRSYPIRVLRDSVVIFEGELESLRRFKDDANEVRNGMECGIGVKNYNDVRVGDNIEVYEVFEVARTV